MAATLDWCAFKASPERGCAAKAGGITPLLSSSDMATSSSSLPRSSAEESSWSLPLEPCIASLSLPELDESFELEGSGASASCACVCNCFKSNSSSSFLVVLRLVVVRRVRPRFIFGGRRWNHWSCLLISCFHLFEDTGDNLQIASLLQGIVVFDSNKKYHWYDAQRVSSPY